MAVHPTAVLPASLTLPADVEVGPYAVLDEDVVVGARVRIGPFCRLHAGTRLGDGVELSEGVVVGGAPQDLKYRGERTGATIGRGTRLREYVTVNRGTQASGMTKVGEDCLLMAYAHVGHDCELGNRLVIANYVQLGGHVAIGDDTVISGLTGVHQFVTIGPGCFLGGGLRAIKDVLPFTKGLGDPMRFGGLNPIGIEKHGFSPAAGPLLKAAYRALASGGREALVAWVVERNPAAGGGGEEPVVGGPAEERRLAGVLGAWLARQSRSILTRPAGIREGSGIEPGEG